MISHQATSNKSGSSGNDDFGHECKVKGEGWKVKSEKWKGGSISRFRNKWMIVIHSLLTPKKSSDSIRSQTAFHLQHWIKNSPLISSEVMKRILRRIGRDNLSSWPYDKSVSGEDKKSNKHIENLFICHWAKLKSLNF